MSGLEVLFGREYNPDNLAVDEKNSNVIWVRYPSLEYNLLRSHGWGTNTGVHADGMVWIKMERPQ